MESIRPVSRGLIGNARDTVSFGYSHVVGTNRHIVRGTGRTRCGTLLMTGVTTILCRNH